MKYIHLKKMSCVGRKKIEPYYIIHRQVLTAQPNNSRKLFRLLFNKEYILYIYICL